MASACDAGEYDDFVDSLYSSIFPGLEVQNIQLEEMNTADSDFLDLSSQRDLIEVANSEDFMENDGKKKRKSRKRSRELEASSKVQTTIPVMPFTSVQANASHIHRETRRIEQESETLNTEESAPSRGEEEEDVEGEGDVEPVKKTKKGAWKDLGYDELSKMYRVFTNYEKTLYEFAGEFAEFSYRAHPFWLGRTHVYETKQRAIEFLFNVVTSSAQAHGDALREFREHLMGLPFSPGSFQNGNRIIASHPTEDYTTRRLVNAVGKLGKAASTADLLCELESKQRLIDAKQVCETFQIVKAGISTSPDTCTAEEPERAAMDKPMNFADFKENYFLLIKSFFHPHGEKGFSKATKSLRDKVGLQVCRSFVAFLSGEFKSYSAIYSPKNKVTKKELDSVLRDHTKKFKANFQAYMEGLGKTHMFE